MSKVEVGAEIAANFLEHYGVRGMKWGVRNDKGHEGERAKTKKIAKLDEKFARDRSTPGTWVKLHNAAADRMNSHDIDRINNKPEYKAAADRGDFLRDTPIRKAYYHEMQNAFLSNLEKAASDMGTNASGTKKYAILEGTDGAWGVTLTDVKHAAEDPKVEFWTTPMKNEDGFISELVFGRPGDLAQSDMDFEQTLAHYGVPGMKWGVRRRKPRTPVDVSVKERPGKKVKTRGGSNQPASEDAIKAARSRQVARRSSLDSLSNAELQHLVNRMGLEDRYSQLMRSENRMSTGRVVAKNVLREFDGDLTLELAKGVAGATGNTLSPKTQTSIRLGTAITRAAFGVKNSQVNKKEQAPPEPKKKS